METIKSNLELGIVSFSGFNIKTKIIDGKEKKNPIQMPPWRQIDKNNCLNYAGLNVAVICGKISNISVIDFDDMNTYEQVVNDYPELRKFKQVRTNKGIHIYGLYNEDLHTTTNAFEMYKGIDIRNDDSIVFAPPTRYSLLNGTIIEYRDMGGKILPFPSDLIQKQKYIQKDLIKKKKEQEKINKIQRKMNNEPCSDMHEILLKIIHAGLLDHKADDYHDWIQVGFAIFNSIKDFELFDFIKSLDFGLDTVINENVLNISGGQRQRIAIARAFYKNTDVIIMDEPTNSLDKITEKRVISKILENRLNKTIILITHNEDIAKYADRVLRIE